VPTIKQSRFPELRLPRLERDDIARALSEVKLPEVRIPDVDPSKIELPRIDLSDIEMPKVDVRRAIDDAAVRVGLRSRSSRLPWPVIGGLAIVLGLVAFVVSRPTVRLQLQQATRNARQRIDEMRQEREIVSVDPTDVASPVASSAWTDDDITAEVEVVPDGPTGADPFQTTNGIPAFEESETSTPV
jgi:hypothetical protein